jgi:glycosyltransferase involved in cell wall biosynthesis
LREILGLSGERITVIPNGLSRAFRPLPTDACRGLVSRKYGLDGPYLLHVGGTNPRKNLESLIFAYSRVRKRLDGLPILAVAGSAEEGSTLDLLTRALGLRNDVRFLGYVAAKDLPYLYGASSLFVYPSLYEGFGLPPLEAMACGTPVVTADNSALPEVVGDAALSVNAEDVKALAEAIERAWNDPALRESLRSGGIARAGLFSWERSARETLRVYDEVAALRNPGRAVGPSAEPRSGAPPLL